MRPLQNLVRRPLPLVLAFLAPAAAAQSGPVVPQGKFLPPEPALARTLSRVAIDGTTSIVGYADADDVGNDKGAVHVVERQASGAWVQTAKLLPSSATGVISFGASLDVDGDLAVVGDNQAGSLVGRAWVFRRVAGVWSQEAVLDPIYAWPQKQLGTGAAVSGTTILLGAGAANTFATGTNTGAIWFFEHGGGAWNPQGPLFASDMSGGTWFGRRVALDGDRAVVTGLAEKVYVFERPPGGAGPWSEAQILTSPVANVTFGDVADVDGDWIAVGATGDDTAASNAGAVYLYRRQPGGWTAAGMVTASDAAANDWFGGSVALRGGRLAVGAQLVDGAATDAGAVYVFEREPDDSWVEVAKLVDPDQSEGDAFGAWVAVSRTGELAVAAPEDDDVVDGLGTVFHFDAETLSTDVATLSVATGGAQALDVQAGTPHAGRLYFVAGSVTGTSPGTPLAPGVVLPLVYDWYSALTVSSPNQPPLLGSFGTLGAGGGAQAQFALPPGFPSLAGTVVRHAFVVLDPSSPWLFVLASNPSALGLVP